MWGLRSALLITPFAVLLAAFFCFFGARFIEGDTVEEKGQIS